MMTELASYLSVSVSTFVVSELLLLFISLPWLSNLFRPWFEFRDKHSSLDLALAELAERYAYLGVYHNEWEDRGIRAELTRIRNTTLVRCFVIFIGFLVSPFIFNATMLIVS